MPFGTVARGSGRNDGNVIALSGDECRQCCEQAAEGTCCHVAVVQRPLARSPKEDAYEGTTQASRREVASVLMLDDAALFKPIQMSLYPSPRLQWAHIRTRVKWLQDPRTNTISDRGCAVFRMP
jgi:hypothetical protein